MERKSYFGPMVMRASRFCIIFPGAPAIMGWGQHLRSCWWEMVSTQDLCKARCQPLDAAVKNHLSGIGLRQLLANHPAAPWVLEAGEC